MAWRIAIILSEDRTALLREMPVWALDTAERREEYQKILLARVRDFWPPEPALTLFEAGGASGPLEIFSNMLATILEHHPRATCLDLIGISPSDDLSEILQKMDFEPLGEMEDGIAFRKPVAKMTNVPELIMDARDWRSRDDLYDSFFRLVGRLSGTAGISTL